MTITDDSVLGAKVASVVTALWKPFTFFAPTKAQQRLGVWVKPKKTMKTMLVKQQGTRTPLKVATIGFDMF